MANIFWSRWPIAEYKAKFEMLMAEAERLNESMRQTRIEIKLLKAETKIIRDETRSLLNNAETEQQAQQRQSEIAAREEEKRILQMEYARLCAACNPPRSPDERLF